MKEYYLWLIAPIITSIVLLMIYEDQEIIGPYINLQTITLISVLMGIIILNCKLIRKNKLLYRADIFLSISIGGYLAAEILWFAGEYLGWQIYGGIPDIFYGIQIIGEILFCIIIIKHFEIKFTKERILILGSFCLIIILCYAGLSSNFIWMDNFNLGLFFITAGAITICLSLIVRLGVKSKINVRFWNIMCLAFIAQWISNFWYYVSENISEFSYSKWYNIGWLIYIVLMIYGIKYAREIFYQGKSNHE